MNSTPIRSAALSALLAVSASSAAIGQGIETFDGIAGVKQVDTDASVEMNGVSVTARGRVGGSLELNGASADGEAEVGGDLMMNAASAEFAGRVEGRTWVNAGGATLDGVFEGPTELNAGRATLRGDFAGPVVIHGGRAELEADFASPVRFTGDAERGLFRRGDRSEVLLAGRFGAGGEICAHEVIVTAGATFADTMTVIADTPPRIEADGVEANIIYEQRQGRRCD